MAIANSSMIRTGGIVSRVSAGIGLATLGIGFVAARAATNYQQAMNIVQVATKANEKEMTLLSNKAIALGKDFKLPNTSAKDAADAMVTLGKAGFSVNQVLASTRGVLQLGLAANIDFADAAMITARTLKAFNLEADQSGKVANLLAAASLKSTAEIEDLAYGLQNASGQFQSAGYGVDTLVVSLARLVDAGVSGEYAGTALKTMLIRLQSPTKAAADIMEKFNIDIYDAAGNMRPMPAIIDAFSKAFANSSAETRNQALNTIFGTRANQAMIKLIQGGVPAWNKYKDAIVGTNAAQQLTEARTKGMAGAAGALGSAAETLAIQLGTAMLPALEKVTRALAEWIAGLDPNKIISFFTVIKDTAMSVLTPVINFFKTDLGQSFAIAAASGYVLVRMFLAVKAAITAVSVASQAMKGNIVMLGALAVGAGIGLLAEQFIKSKMAAAEAKLEFEELANATKTLGDAFNSLKDANLDLRQAKLDAANASDRLAQSQSKEADALEKYGRGSREYAEAARETEQADIDRERAVRRVEEADKTANETQVKRNQLLGAGSKAVFDLLSKFQGMSPEVQAMALRTSDVNEKLKELATRNSKAALELKNMGDTAGSKTAAGVALLATKVLDFIDKEKRIPEKREIKREMKEVNFDKFYKNLLKIENQLGAMAGKAGGQGTATGVSWGQGIASGITAMIPIIQIAAASAVASMTAAGQAEQKSGSPGKVPEEKVGKPWGQGVLLGIMRMGPEIDQEARARVTSATQAAASALATLATTIQLPLDRIRQTIAKKLGEATTAIQQAKMAEAIQMKIEALAAKVAAMQEKLATAFRRMADYALRAFDARTEAGLDKIEGKLQARLRKIDADLARALARIDAQAAAKTPAEAELERRQAEIEERGRQEGLADAQQRLAEAQAGGDPEAILQAERDLRAAEEAIQLAALEKQAENERIAADALAAQNRQVAEDRAEARRIDANNWATEAKKQYASQRALQRENLEIFLEQQERILAKQPKLWTTVHGRIMKKFKDEFGPDFKTAGFNLGKGYVEGLEQSMNQLESVAKKLAQLIADYLKGKSPPPKGPLSDIDRWGRRLMDAFLSGFEVQRINSVLDSIRMGEWEKPVVSKEGTFEGELVFGGEEKAGPYAGLWTPDWANKELFGFAASLALAMGKLDEFITGIGPTGSIRSNGRLLDLLSYERSRWNWTQFPDWIARILDIMRSQSLTGAEAAKMFGLARGGLTLGEGAAWLHPREIVAPEKWLRDLLVGPPARRGSDKIQVQLIMDGKEMAAVLVDPMESQFTQKKSDQGYLGFQ